MERCMRAAAGAPLSSTAVAAAAAAAGTVMLLLALAEPRVACTAGDAPFAASTLSVPRVVGLGLLAGGAVGFAAWYNIQA